ncbi:MAG: hypothetical protein H6839_02130 [Planctomycetes bacterium]|nr:hypothetical protein [Planctomycetota bacterium]
MRKTLAVVMMLVALAGCGADEPAPVAEPSPAPAEKPQADTVPTTTPRKDNVVDAPVVPKPIVKPEMPAKDPGKIDYVAEARRCLTNGDQQGYQAAIDAYNKILKRDGSPFTIVRLDQNTITYLTADGSELKVNGWHDAMPGG